ncbi:hypothetical protein LI249_13745 [Dorea formicigenerans]|uniref:hypothetical protein n=1 Tax=Dorea formicigenerans TaxID=39486 RepID=UPI001D080E5D|nr:hypothetical protein [Dorea formicigenerans]MCC3185822.1 hypothetical protein [[Clostridium] innocuum]MCB6284189.1 hypothetical protein [Dorea formicigenerans]MCB6381605.1 hypothetical protein [Dorea formicigenerans]MCB6384536.1 hypothetical protein [Dorea formicigenerans]MCB6389749.1 hypothetical protein [Dorea formicigenerans]
MEIITGYTGKPHVTSEQDRDVNIGVVGKGSYVLQTGMQLAAEVSSNNEIKIRDGVLMHQGCTASIKKNTYDSLIIINGSQGMKRIDLIVARYEKNQDNGIESLDLKVIQGTPAESTPTVPEYTEGDIQAGDYVADMPMYQVIIDGLNITEVKKVCEVAPDIGALKKEIAELNSNKKVECFSKTVATDTNILADFSPELNQIIKNGGKIVSAIPGTTTNSNNALVYGKVAIQALPDWSEVYVRCNSNYYSGLGGTTTLNLLVIYV